MDNGQRLRRTDVIYCVSYSDKLNHVKNVIEDLIARSEYGGDPEDPGDLASVTVR